MPIPRGRFEPEMMIGLEVSGPRPAQTYDEKCRADDDVKPVKPGRHEESRRIDPVGEMERSVAVFPGLNRRETNAEKHSQRQTLQQAAAVALDQRMVRPGNGGPREQEDQGV